MLKYVCKQVVGYYESLGNVNPIETVATVGCARTTLNAIRWKIVSIDCGGEWAMSLYQCLYQRFYYELKSNNSIDSECMRYFGVWSRELDIGVGFITNNDPTRGER